MGNGSFFGIEGGLDFDLARDVLTLECTSVIPGFETFEAQSTLGLKKTRPFASVSYGIKVADNSMITFTTGVHASLFGPNPRFDAGVSLGARF